MGLRAYRLEHVDCDLLDMGKASSRASSTHSSSAIRTETLAKLRTHRLRRSLAPSVERLGGLQAVYDGPRVPLWLRLLGPLCILFGLFILFAFWRDYTLLFSWWPRTQVGLLLVLSAIWLLVGLLLTVIVIFSARLRVLVCADGLLVLQRTAKAIAWSQIEQFWKSIRVKGKARVTHTYSIRTLNGNSYVFNDELPDVGRLGHIIERRMTRARLSELLDAYYAGQAVHFERLTLQSQGIIFQQFQMQRKRKKRQVRQYQEPQNMLPWDELDAFSIDDTTLNVYKKGQYWDWLALPVAELPNVSILKNMVDAIVHERRYGPLQKNIALFQANIPVIFGDIHLTKHGIDVEHGKVVLAWNELDGIGIGEHEVIIKRKGRVEEWHALPLWGVQQASQLRDFVDYLLQAQ